MDKTKTFLHSRKQVINLLKQKPVVPITFDARKKCYTTIPNPQLDEKKTKLRGITSDLKRHFWPHWKLPEVSSDQKLVNQALKEAGLKTKGGLKGKAADRRKAGMKRGTFVGRAITKWANSKDPRKHPLRSKFQYVKRLVEWCKKCDAWPIAGEFVVGDPSIRRATGVDLVLMRMINGELVVELAELKTGMGAYWKTPVGKMKGRLNMLNCSPYEQALVQLAVTTQLFAKCRPHIKIGSCSVIHVSDEGIDHTSVNPDLLKPIGRLALRTISTV